MTTIFTFPDCDELLDRFLSLYKVANFVSDSPHRKDGLKPRGERVCRFCGRDNTQTKFKKVAHMIPNLLGNRFLLSDSECDECNWKFSLYENDLANFLGISRTVMGVKGKESVPTFKSPDNVITARSTDFHGIKDGIKIERSDVNNSAFQIMDAEGRAEISTLKNPYVPSRVYKAFLKMALSVMPEVQMPNYAWALRLLEDDQYDERLSRFFTVVHYTLPHTLSATFPHCFMFEKIDAAERRVTHQFYLRYQNNVYLLPVPLHHDDIVLGIYEDEVTTLLSPPILFTALTDESETYFSDAVKDLSSSLPIKEEETITIRMIPNAMANTQGIDRVTGQVLSEPFDPTVVKAIYLAPLGSSLNLPE
ncbi:HNH endonuclease [Hymenobacter setariae]|uniref:HNH endonuclease n=1 Tax=Hymenobacter setariae TaxID=2594794 RepID=A0A558BJR1_9BACT|nr:HNH endonuclease [Hymenobacter setariae]TVT36744.1 HNH endonuclease [Hymenobacter setariae]